MLLYKWASCGVKDSAHPGAVAEGRLQANRSSVNKRKRASGRREKGKGEIEGKCTLT
jgi:hypothetical protein